MTQRVELVALMKKRASQGGGVGIFKSATGTSCCEAVSGRTEQKENRGNYGLEPFPGCQKSVGTSYQTLAKSKSERGKGNLGPAIAWEGGSTTVRPHDLSKK